MVKRVGDKLPNEVYKCFTYPMVKYDEKGWADSNEFLPLDFDMCAFRIEGQKNTIKGWVQKNSWDGLWYKNGYKVTHWKRHDDED